MTQLEPTKPEPDRFVPFSARLMAAIRAKETERIEIACFKSMKQSLYK
ncbi:MAG: hypothetical protein QNJ72_37655 [Pleurocapsa sp. MO_226.B13]|nr:hypothetical protein [Pleurocapsa sp. MO_226.B13]